MPQRPPTFDELFRRFAGNPDDFGRAAASGSPVDNKGRYLHWDELRHRTPPDGFTRELWWLSMVFGRRGTSKELPLRAVDGSAFRFSNIDAVQRLTHYIDQHSSGQILTAGRIANDQSRDQYLVRSLMEEAITSSQLEGANTTRRVAKEMLASGRSPRDRSERMIFNNFQAMEYARSDITGPLTTDAILELHRIVTEGTLDDPRNAGRLQTADDDRIGVYSDGTLLHAPPSASELPERLAALCRFANGEETHGFIHPVVRAIIVHFWLAYDHPFYDGNGRTARALYYWTMLREGYWLAQFLSVSSIIRKARTKYERSFLYVETDDNDITYFVLAQLEVIKSAIRRLNEYLERKASEATELDGLLRGSPHLNHRQLDVVLEALQNPSETFTIKTHQRRHAVSNESARSDLLGLTELCLLTKRKIGKKYVFDSPPDMTKRVRELSETTGPNR